MSPTSCQTAPPRDCGFYSSNVSVNAAAHSCNRFVNQCVSSAKTEIMPRLITSCNSPVTNLTQKHTLYALFQCFPWSVFKHQPPLNQHSCDSPKNRKYLLKSHSIFTRLPCDAFLRHAIRAGEFFRRLFLAVHSGIRCIWAACIPSNSRDSAP